MKLFLVHCGFYDADVCEGLYESHVNFFICANSQEDARAQVRLQPEFIRKKMHVDGLQEIEAVGGHRVRLNLDAALQGATIIHNLRHRDLAARPSPGTPQGAPTAR